MGLGLGDTLQGGKYIIEKRLRVGLTSVSYLAKRTDGSRWMLKVLDHQVLVSLSDDERNRAETLFMQEAVKLARCSGTPHIVKSEMPFKEGELVCLPMEYISGDSLADRPHPILKEAIALNYVHQIGEALGVVHSQGLVHRDIRPSNIFLRIDGDRVNAVLAGFGLAIDCDTELTRTRANERRDGFSPIELYGHGQPVGEYTDVYSLAATLYALLTGVAPTSAKEVFENKQAFVLPQTQNSEITGRTARAIKAGMLIAPEKRPQSVTDWLGKLKTKQQSFEKQNVLSTKKKAVDWAKWLGVIIAALAVLVSFLTWFVDKIDTDREPKVIESVTTEEDSPPSEKNDAQQEPSVQDEEL